MNTKPISAANAKRLKSLISRQGGDDSPLCLAAVVSDLVGRPVTAWYEISAQEWDELENEAFIPDYDGDGWIVRSEIKRKIAASAVHFRESVLGQKRLF